MIFDLCRLIFDLWSFVAESGRNPIHRGQAARHLLPRRTVLRIGVRECSLIFDLYTLIFDPYSDSLKISLKFDLCSLIFDLHMLIFDLAWGLWYILIWSAGDGTDLWSLRWKPIKLYANPAHIRAAPGGVGAFKMGWWVLYRDPKARYLATKCYDKFIPLMLETFYCSYGRKWSLSFDLWSLSIDNWLIISNYAPTIDVTDGAAQYGAQQCLWLWGDKQWITEVLW